MHVADLAVQRAPLATIPNQFRVVGRAEFAGGALCGAAVAVAAVAGVTTNSSRPDCVHPFAVATFTRALSRLLRALSSCAFWH